MNDIININRARLTRNIEKLSEVECDPEKINETEKLIHQITKDLFEWVNSTVDKPTPEICESMRKAMTEWCDSKTDW